MPTLVSTLAICIVFVPIFFLSGVAGSLFAPLAMAVVFANFYVYPALGKSIPFVLFYPLLAAAGFLGGARPVPGARITYQVVVTPTGDMREGYLIAVDHSGKVLPVTSILAKSQTLDAAILNMRRNGRLVISGQISEYNTTNPRGIRHTLPFITQRLRMEGLVVYDFAVQFGDARQQMAEWVNEGRLTWREEIIEGLEQAPAAFIGLFSGESFGRRLVHVS